MKTPNIICTGMLDTKEDEIRYLAEKVKELGANPIVVDMSLGHEAKWADVPLGTLLMEIGKTPEEIFRMPRGEALDYVQKAGTIAIMKMYTEGKVDGIISWTGSVGGVTVSHVMRQLPLGVPKLLLCTSAADARRYIGVTDMVIANPISEKGVNKITEYTVGNCVAAMVGMATYNKNRPVSKAKPLAAVTIYGTTTPAAIRCGKYMEARGWDVAYFHSMGIGAVMEDLIRRGEITALYDITIGEISNNYFPQSKARNPKDWTGDRFTAAFDMGIPVVAAPGGLAQSPFSDLKWENLTDQQHAEYASGLRKPNIDGKAYMHSPETMIFTPTLEENGIFAKYCIERFNKAKGSAVFLMPMKGFSAYDQEESHASLEMGWAAHRDGPVWVPDDENPHWSKRATLMWDIMKDKLNRENPHIDLIKCDMHLMDPEFSTFANRIMDDMLDGTYRPGMYKDALGVVECLNGVDR